MKVGGVGVVCRSSPVRSSLESAAPQRRRQTDTITPSSREPQLRADQGRHGPGFDLLGHACRVPWTVSWRSGATLQFGHLCGHPRPRLSRPREHLQYNSRSSEYRSISTSCLNNYTRYLRQENLWCVVQVCRSPRSMLARPLVPLRLGSCVQLRVCERGYHRCYIARHGRDPTHTIHQVGGSLPLTGLLLDKYPGGVIFSLFCPFCLLLLTILSVAVRVGGLFLRCTTSMR